MLLAGGVHAQEAASVGVGDTSLELSGKTSPNAYVTVQNGGVTIGSFTADSTGLFSHSFPAQTPGIMQLGVGARDTSALTTDTVSLQVNLQEHFPTPVTVFLPPTMRLSTTSIMAGQTIDLSGMALPNSGIVLSVDNQSIGTSQVDSDGNWHIPLTTLGIAAGTHQIFATDVDTDGGQSFPTSSRSFTVLSPTPPVIGSSSGTPRIMPIKPAVPRITSPSNATSTMSSTITVSGSSEADVQIELWLNGKAVGAVLPNTSGAWSVPIQLQTSTNTITARACRALLCSDFSPPITVYFSSTAGKNKLQISLEKYRLNSSSGHKITITAHAKNYAVPTSFTFIWGDGTQDAFKTKNEAMTASHVYAHSGHYGGEVRIVDTLGNVAISYFTVEVVSKQPWLSEPPFLLLWLIVLLLIVVIFVVRWLLLSKSRRRRDG